MGNTKEGCFGSTICASCVIGDESTYGLGTCTHEGKHRCASNSLFSRAATQWVEILDGGALALKVRKPQWRFVVMGEHGPKWCPSCMLHTLRVPCKCT